MQIIIKDFSITMEVKTKGVEFEVRSPDGSKHIGDLCLTKTNLIWCKGRTPRKTGKAVPWEKFIAWAEQQ